MPILILQHSESGGPGRLGGALRDRGLALDIRRADLPPTQRSPRVPRDLDNINGIVILGGEQNVTDIAQYHWMNAEAELIRQAHAAQLPVIGICLGAQLIAHALGGTVGPKETPDCGFRTLDINTTGQIEAILAGIAWHHPQLFACGQEVKQTAPGTVVLASTDTTKVAAFKVGLRTYGFLFHVECTRDMAADLGAIACGTSPASPRQDMATQLAAHYGTYARLSDRLCENIVTLLFPESRRLVA